MEAEDLEEAADLALTTLIEVDFEVGGVVRMADHLLEPQVLPFFDRALEQAGRQRRVVVAVKDDLVAFDDSARGVHHLVGEVPVIGQDQEAFGILVEAADAEEAEGTILRRHHIEDRLSAVGVVVGAEVAARLVHHQHHRPAERLDVLALADDGIHGGVDRLPGHRQLAVDHHGPRGDQPLRLTTGADPRLGEVLVNTHGSFGRHALPFEAFAPQGETIIRRADGGLFSPSAGRSS